MKPVIALLSTLDTKAEETGFLADAVRRGGGRPLILDLGVIGSPGLAADVTREQLAETGGRSLADLLKSPTREEAGPIMIAGAKQALLSAIDDGSVHAAIGLGGTQGTTLCTQVMQALPYGFPKIMVSTVASGDTSPFVGIKDITMMFSVGDLLGLNPFTRRVLAQAAGAALGMAGLADAGETVSSDRRVVGMTNLGLLTEGALLAVRRLEAAGLEAIVFHAVGSGGRAMEQMMREGLIHGVFDYAMGEIADELWQGLRSAGPERLTVAAEVGLPQVIVPGGAEHLGLLVDPPNTVPANWADHLHVFHSPVVFVPRLRADEIVKVGRAIAERLANAGERTSVFLPEGGTSRYSIEGGPLHDPESDRALFDAIESNLPDTVDVVRRPEAAEDEAFVAAAVDRLLGWM